MAKIVHQEVRSGPVTSTVPLSQSLPPAQNYVVEDFSDIPATVDDRLAEFESSHQFASVPTEKPKIDQESQKKLESLIFMGRYTKEVEIAGHKFEFSTLTHKETNEIVTKLFQLGEQANNFVIHTFTLSNAIKSIDGVSLNDFAIDGIFATSLERRAAIIDQMQLALVERLYAAYETLVKEADEVVYGEKIKN
jgi:hypothetical protein